MSINMRIRILRKDGFKMNMENFGKILGITKSGVSEIEAGRRNVTEKHIKLLCNNVIEGKAVNETWLRTGQGNMFLKKTENQEIQDFADKVMQDTPESFRRRYVSMLSKLTDEQWDFLFEMTSLLVDPDQKQKKKKKSLSEMTDEDIEEEGRKYAARIREEKEAEERSSASSTTEAKSS